MILFSSIIIIDSISAEENVPKGFETYYMRGYGFNVPSSYKLIDEGWDEEFCKHQFGKTFIKLQ